MDGLFSRVFLENIHLTPDTIINMVLPDKNNITGNSYSHDELSVFNPDSIESVARQLKITIFKVSKNDFSKYTNILKLSKPDIIIVACFPYKIPESIYNKPSYGAYNIHPSLLPAYRGPTPLFWQFYYGEKNTGVTIHALDSGFDTGDIVLQKKVSFDDGDTTIDATRKLSLAASRLFEQAIIDINKQQVNLIKQESSQASYYSWPGKSEFILNSNWKVRRAYNFICATRYWNHPYKIILGNNEEMEINDVLGYDVDLHLENMVEIRSDQLVIQFYDGCLIATGH